MKIFKNYKKDNNLGPFMAKFATNSVQKCAKVQSHIAQPKKGRTHAHRTLVSKCFSHAHRTRASVRARVRVRI